MSMLCNDLRPVRCHNISGNFMIFLITMLWKLTEKNKITFKQEAFAELFGN